MKRLKNTNIRSIIVLVILFALLICMISAGIFIYKNRNSIMALYYTYTNKVDVLEQSKQNTDEKAMDAIKEFGVETVRPLTEEEEKKLNSGEISEEDAVFLLHSGYYKIVEVSNDFEAIFYKPVFEGEDLFSKSVYKSYMKDLEKPNGDLIHIRYVPYMQYKDNAFAIVMPIDSNLENIENVDINNFLVYRYSQMQILRGNIEIEKIGLIPNELQPSF